MKKKSLLILLVMCSIIFITTGTFAYYRYSVNGSIIGKTGNYTFNVTSNSTTTKDINLGSNLKPFDKGSFNLTVKLDNTDCDAYYTLKIEKTNLPKGFKFLAQNDNISPFSTHSKYFDAGDNKTDTVTIYWYWDGNVDDEDDNSFIGKTISANIVINSKQTNPAYMKNGYSEDENANGGTEFWNNTYKPYVRTITFDNNLSNLPSTCNEENLCWDISYSQTQNKKVYGYLVDSGLTIEETDSSTSTTVNKSLYNLYIVSEAQTFAPNDSSFIFSFYKYENSKYISNLISINFNNNFNTSNVTSMSGMFYYCEKLTDLDISNFNTAKVIRMSKMFSFCLKLTSLDLSSFNTSNVTDMNAMFYNCVYLTNLDLSDFNTSNVTDMSAMFNGCLSLTNLDLSNFNTSNVTDMEFMFWGCSSLASLDLSNFDTAKVNSMYATFYDCRSLTNLDLSDFNTSNVASMDRMFADCTSLSNLDLSDFNTSNVTNMDRMFADCTSLTNLDLSDFNTSNVTNMFGMFYKCDKLQTEITITGTSITNYANMFSNALTDVNAYVIINYSSEAESIAQGMKSTAPTSNQSKITLKQI